ncbi:MAG: insulinase family protein, partial [Thermoguttaceae bacterium]|nr:insulinase family protein [Thermoguttaceae bacterium]
MSPLMAFAIGTMLTSAPEEPAASVDSRIPEIAFEKYTLPNGLEVILHEDHSTPIVGVNVWYHVGSKNERPGRTGFAHLFEHMMFQGSKHYDRDYFGPLQQAGGRLNGSTNQDRTNYWETVPSNYLELALWMESDRMGFLLPAMTQEKLDNQRDVVKNERRQSYENRPYGLAYETLLAAAFPPDHPYSWPTIGSMADLNAASRDDVADFFRRYYHPGNASLCIAGDFDPAEAKRLVAKYFGPIPAGPKVEKLRPRPAQPKGERRIRMTDRVGLPRLYLLWPTVPMYAADEAELEILADVLSGGKTARLDKALVREKQIAQDIQAFQNSQEIAGGMMIIATARPGHSLAELESAIQAEIDRLRAEPPSKEEVERAINRLEAQLIRSLESVSDFGGRADRLNMYNVFTGDPGYLKKDFARYVKVDPAGVQRVARQYLGTDRVVLEVTPGRETKITPDPRVEAEEARNRLAQSLRETRLPPAQEVPEDAARQSLPGAGPPPRFTLPPIRRGRLANGIEVLVVENHELPTVN